MGYKEKFFPIVTFTLSTVILAVFLFTYANLDYFQSLLGFIPAHLTPWSFITYTFVHVDYLHVATNLVFLIIAGLALEERIGSKKFLVIYIISAIFSVLFDMIGRVVLGISSDVAFVGASGAIFGLLAVAALVNPSAKFPTILLALTFVVYLQLLPALTLNEMLIVGGSIGIVLLAVLLMHFYMPLNLAVIVLLANWLISIIIKFPIDVSNVGHLGGVIGGLLIFFILIHDNVKKP